MSHAGIAQLLRYISAGSRFTVHFVSIPSTILCSSDKWFLSKLVQNGPEKLTADNALKPFLQLNTTMTKYTRLSDDEDSETSLDINHTLLSKEDVELSTPTSIFPSKVTRSLATFLVILNITLAFTNIWATHSIRSLFDPTETTAIKLLPRADQYLGLSDSSRALCMWISLIFRIELCNLPSYVDSEGRLLGWAMSENKSIRKLYLQCRRIR